VTPVEVFVINLPDDADRRDAIGAQLDEMGISYRFEAAVDARGMDAHDMDEMIRSNRLTRQATLDMSKGSIGCLLSHQAVYQRMIDEDLPMAVILEDDADVSPGLAKILGQIPAHLGADELLLLYYRYTQPGPFEVSILDRVDLGDGVGLYAPLHKNIHSTLGYAISQDVARGLLRVNVPIELPADVWSQFYDRGAFTSIRIAYPRGVEQRDVPSTRMHPGSRTATRDTSQPLGTQVKQQVGRMPVARQILERRRTRETIRKTTPRFVETPSPYRPGGDSGRATT
jgi:glycosyl transferase family 25